MTDLEDPNRRELGRNTYPFQRVLLHPTRSRIFRPRSKATVHHLLMILLGPLLVSGMARAQPPAQPSDEKQIQPPPTTTSHKAAEPEPDREAERINQRLKELEEKN